MELASISFSELRQALIDELVKLLGFSPHGVPRKILNPVLFPPANLFARVATKFDHIVEQFGLREASDWVLARFIRGVDAQGVDHVPENGPLLVVSNHPGAVDGLAIVSQLPRQDLKIVVSAIPFVQKLQSAAKHVIFAASDAHERMTTVRSIIRQLQSGGSLLIFPTGTVDPDPAIMPGAFEALRNWSPSIELILRRVPETNILVTIVSGVLKPQFLQNPIARLQKGVREQQKVAEFLQIAQQLFFPHSLSVIPQISFAKPVTSDQLSAPEASSGILSSIIAKAQDLLTDHMAFAFRK